MNRISAIAVMVLGGTIVAACSGSGAGDPGSGGVSGTGGTGASGASATGGGAPTGGSTGAGARGRRWPRRNEHYIWKWGKWQREASAD